MPRRTQVVGIEIWSGRRESNPHEKLGKLSGYHYITPAEPDEP
jgi:hypothetical protein